MHNQVIVRRAENGDIGWLTSQLKAFSRFYGSKFALLQDEAYVAGRLEEFIDAHLMLVAADEQGPIGFIGGLLTPHFMNPQIRVLAECFWWVDETRRGGRAASLLLDAFVEYGRLNADWITMTLEHKSPISDRALLKRGFEPSERSYLLEVV